MRIPARPLARLALTLFVSTLIASCDSGKGTQPVASDGGRDAFDGAAGGGGTAGGAAGGGGTLGGAGSNGSDGAAGGGGDAADAAAGSGGPDGAADGSSDGSDGADRGGDAPDGPSATLTVRTATELAQESAANYDDNVSGVISGKTLARWVSSWPAERPAGVTGRLIILHPAPSVAAAVKHVTGDGVNVFSYIVAQSELLTFRNTGVSREDVPPDGAAADAFLKKYGIDPTRDYVVAAFEQLPGDATANPPVAATTNVIVQQLGRAWFFLRYWGFPKERLAVLSGSVNWNQTNQALPVSERQANTPPNNGTASVRALRDDNTVLQITLGEILDILKEKPGAPLKSTVRFVDARGGAEALGLQKSTTLSPRDCLSYTGTGNNARCSPPFEGRLKGARAVQWTQFVDTAANGFRFISKQDAKTIFDAQSEIAAGQLVVNYCRTNQRSLVTGLVGTIVLGYPSRFYETSFTEWSHMAHGPTPGTKILPFDSPWRTDLPGLTEHAEVAGWTPGGSVTAAVTITAWKDGPNYNLDQDISPVVPAGLTPTGTRTDLHISEDRLYKQE